jgi:hypothetical protein
MKRPVLLLWAALLGLSQVLAAANDSWTGLWKLQREDQPERLVFLVVSDTSGKLSIRYFDRFWGEEKVFLQPSAPDHLVFDTVQTSRAARFDLARNSAGKVSGIWTLRHPQFQDTKPFSAVRALSLNQWQPFEGLKILEKPKGVIDLNAFLLEKAPLKDLAAFVAFWESEVDPKFYVLIEDVLYRDAKTTDKKALLTPIYELLKSRDFRQTATRSAKEMERVIAQIKEKGALFYRKNPVVLMPSLGSLEASTDSYDNRLTIRVGVDRVAKRYPGDQFAGRLAREQLQLALYKQFAILDERLGIDLIREGISSRMAVVAGVAPSADAAIGVPAGTCAAKQGQLKAHKKLLLSRINEKKESEVRRLMEGENGSREGFMVAYEFGERMLSRFKPEEVLAMLPMRVVELLREYLKEDS